jgi:PleD family two-component response regulator
VTLSAGVATSGVIQDPETLVGAADAALYRAKRGGRNRVEVATATDMKAG